MAVVLASGCSCGGDSEDPPDAQPGDAGEAIEGSGPWLAYRRRPPDAPEQLVLVRADTRRSMVALEAPIVWSGAWAPVGRRLAVAWGADADASTQVDLLTVDDEGVVERRTLHDGLGRSVRLYWSPDGQHLAYSIRDDEERGPTLWLLDADGAEAPRELGPVPPSPGVAWNPPGDRIAFDALDADGAAAIALAARDTGFEVRLVTLPDTATEPRVVTGNTRPFEGWAPDGRRLAFLAAIAGPDVSSLTRLHVVDVDEWVARQVSPDLSPGVPSGAGRPVWSPSSRALIYRDVDETGPFDRGLWVIEDDGDGFGAPTQVGESDENAAWLDDGRLVITPDRDHGRVGIVTLTSSGPEREEVLDTGQACEASVHAQPLRVVLLCSDSTMLLWRDGDTGPTEIGAFSRSCAETYGWAPDGSACLFADPVGADAVLHELVVATASARALRSRMNITSLREDPWSADGRYALLVSRTHSLGLVDRVQGAVELLEPEGEPRNAIAYGFEGVRLR